MRTLKVIFLALLLGGIGAAALIDEVAIGRSPPVARLPGGASPNVLVIPARVIHTTHDIGEGTT